VRVPRVRRSLVPETARTVAEMVAARTIATRGHVHAPERFLTRSRQVSTECSSQCAHRAVGSEPLNPIVRAQYDTKVGAESSGLAAWGRAAAARPGGGLRGWARMGALLENREKDGHLSVYSGAFPCHKEKEPRYDVAAASVAVEVRRDSQWPPKVILA